MNNLFKTTLGIALTLGFAQCSTAQIKAVNSAEYALMSNSVEDLITAKEEIDKAKINPKSAELPKMYLVRSDVYARIAGAKNNELLKGLTDGAGLEAMVSIRKFHESTMPKKAEEKENGTALAGNAFAAGYNEAISFFATKSYDTLCIYYAELISMYGYLDTAMSNNLANNKITKASLTETYAQVATLHSDKSQKIAILQGLVDNGNTVPAIVEGLSKAYLTNGDTVKAENCIRTALVASNNSDGMFQVLVNFFVGIKQEQRLYADVDRQIGIEPNSRLYYTRAYLNENQAKYDAAIADYRKAVEMDEFNYDANFNLGLSLMKYESRKLYDKRSAAVGAKKKLVDEELKMLFTDAKKYLERALDNVDYSTTDQINICKALKSACLEIGDTAGAEKYASLIKGME
ncbi:MAG: tetratricopeptide repeat protein [Bacteroidota bacterium]|jgi:tetratricopeptide (TPR) repeat protein